MTTPSVGRIVHYVSYGTPGGEYAKACRAAIVTAVDAENDTIVSLTVFNPTGLFFDVDVPFSTDAQLIGGTWHWPERE